MPEPEEWDVRHPAYVTGLKEGREQGAKHMRDAITRYLTELGITVELPRTMGERKEFEKDWDRRVADAALKQHKPPAMPPGDDPRAGHPIKPLLG